MASRGKRTMLLAAVPCAAVLGFVAFALKDRAEEAWYIHKVETGSAAEVEKYGARLRSIASAQTIPQLRRLLGRKKALILRKDTPLSRTFFETMTAIGKDGVAAVILSLDESERPVARQLFPPGEVLGGKAFLACLQHPEVEVRLESLRTLVSHQKGYGLPGRAFPALITLLDDPSKVVRREAAWALAHPAAENPAVRRELRAVLRDGDPAVRRQAIAALPYARLALAELIEALKDPDQEVRALAFERLGSSGCEEALEPLAAALEDPGIRTLAKSALGSLAKSVPENAPAAGRAIAALLGRLSSSSPKETPHTVTVLGLFGPAARAVVPRAIELLGEDSAEGQLAAAEALSRMGPFAAPAVPVLIRALKTGVPEVRQSAARALGWIGKEAVQAVPALTATLEDPAGAGEVRGHAARALAAIGFFPAETRKAILEAARDRALSEPAGEALGAAAESDEVYREAIAILEAQNAGASRQASVIRGLCRARLKAALPVLLRLAREGATGDLLDSIVHALADLGPEASEAIPVLRKALSDLQVPFRCVGVALCKIDPGETAFVVRSSLSLLKGQDSRGVYDALETLEQLGPEAAEAAPALLHLLKGHRNDPQSASFIAALAAIGRAAVPGLAESLADHNVIVSALAAETLGKIGADAETAVPALEKARSDEDDEVRREAAKALRKIRGAAAPPTEGAKP